MATASLTSSVTGTLHGPTRPWRFYTGNGKTLYANMPSQIVVAQGTPLEGFIEFEITQALTRIAGIILRSYVVNAGFTDLYGAFSYYPLEGSSMPLDVGNIYTMRTPPWAAPANVDRAYNRLQILLAAAAVSSAVAGAIKIRRVGTRVAA